MNDDFIPEAACPSCGSAGVRPFYSVSNVPVHSVMLLASREEALAYPRHDIELAYCGACGHVANLRFDPSIVEYSSSYEETQDYSETFREFQNRLAEDLVRRHDLRHKRVLEIGCGKGEFLKLICAKGNNRGIGFDPAYVGEREPGPSSDRVEFKQAFFGLHSSGIEADMVVCKMTLEHIHNPGDFMSMVRHSMGQREAVVLFQVPDAERILEGGVFWDVYYEHCGYFTSGSLRNLFERTGFEVLRQWKAFDNQYLMLEARPSSVHDGGRLDGARDSTAGEALVNRFRSRANQKIETWKNRLGRFRADGVRVAVWGAGSKAVAFLNLLDQDKGVDCAVDVNPHKDGMFIAGTGHEIVSPSRLVERSPDVVVLMNSIYRGEVSRDLQAGGLRPELLAL